MFKGKPYEQLTVRERWRYEWRAYHAELLVNSTLRPIAKYVSYSTYREWKEILKAVLEQGYLGGRSPFR